MRVLGKCKLYSLSCKKRDSMCSINDCTFDDNDGEIPKNKEKNLLTDTTLCRKCKCENADILLVGQSGYCKSCFLNVTNHKFRAALGKSKIIRPGDLILVDHTGELNSTVLLHLIKAGMSESTHKKLIFKTVVLYIDGKMSKERDMLRQKIARETKASGFNGYAVSMSQVLNEEEATLDVKPIDQEINNNESDDRLRVMLASLADDTSRTDFLSQLRRRLLLSAARKLNCNKIFLADSSVDVATKVLGDVCLGRGAQLSVRANFCDARYADITILKPMRDFMQQELIYYSEYHKINSAKSIESSGKPATSIQALARNFTLGLESQFSGTVSTIFRTADKISPKCDVQQNMEDNCVLCDFVRTNPSGSQVTAMRAIEISKLMSSKCVVADSPSNKQNGKLNCLDLDSDNNEERCNKNAECSCKNNRQGQVTAEDVLKHLCYSCTRIFQNSEILCTLPSPLLSAVQRRIALKNMRDKISDFLL
ncbi:cytoplasmic tRNA 2-thiolation protein 2 isoform X2 [Monomorium pharaonis]|uniref:cytoplasmic tRNA 2-thiolation protein 2 isoform X2 n=1 Tax=Monomorium pharaonis TaxID=307658 RepID=UPI00174737EA|nr:cytoplasmic tRNA 2-thiolation protein 2 isoform X2 [Monomorium pharaonis]